MNLFVFSRDTYEVDVAPEALMLEPFKEVARKNKNNHNLTKKELAFIYLYADIKSDYMYIVDEEERKNELIKDLKLPSGWDIDPVVKKAIDFYKERSTTVNTTLYLGACKAASDINDYLKNSDKLLKERDKSGKPVVDITKIVMALSKIPEIMKNLNKAHQELIAEKQLLEGRTKGSKTLSMFEDGLEID